MWLLFPVTSVIFSSEKCLANNILNVFTHNKLRLRARNSTSCKYFFLKCKHVQVKILPVLTRNWLVSPGWSTSCTAHANIVAKTSRSLNTFWYSTKQEAQLSQRGLAMLHVTQDHSRSFKMTPLSRARVNHY